MRSILQFWPTTVLTEAWQAPYSQADAAAGEWLDIEVARNYRLPLRVGKAKKRRR